MSKPKLPKNCYWRGNTIWAKKSIASTLYRFSLETDNPRAAAAIVRQQIERLKARHRRGGAQWLWGDALKAWGEWFRDEQPFSLRTYDRYLTSIGQIAEWLDGLHVDAIDGEVVDQIVRGRRAADASIATIRRDLTALSSVLGFCKDKRLCENNPAKDKIERLREKRELIVLPELAHVRMVVARCPGLLAKLVEAALATGCRQAELVNAERRDLDRERRQLTVLGKRNKRRTIDLSEPAFSVLDSLTPHLRSRWLFWHGDGEPYRNVAARFAAIVGTVAKEAQKQGTDFRPFRFHDLRHRFAVDYLKAGGNIYFLSEHLGHTSVKTTEIYLAYLSPLEKHTAKFGTQKRTQIERSGTAKSAESA